MLSRAVRLHKLFKPHIRSFTAIDPMAYNLTVEIPGTPKLKPAKDLKPPETIVTQLPSGLSVASRETYQAVSSIGVFIGSGSMNETPEEYGCTYALEKMALAATELTPADIMAKRMENIGGKVTTRSGRDFHFFIIDVLRDNVEECLQILAEAVFCPCFHDEDIRLTSDIIKYENENSFLTQEYSQLATDYIYAAMYGDKTPYGHPLRYRNPALNHAILSNYWKKHYIPKNMKVVGMGVNHDRFVSMVEKYFPFSSSTSSATLTQPPSDNSILKGGAYHIEIPEINNVVVSLGFHSDGFVSKDMVKHSLLNTILGGGSMFSAGGPGKGMYSRLYLDVMNKYGWFESCNIQEYFHRQQGVVTLQAVVPLTYVPRTTQILCDHVRQLIHEPLTDDEMQRAKNQLKSMMFLNLEHSAVYCEEIGHQLLSYNQQKSAECMAEEVDRITKEDIMKSVKDMLDYPIAYSVFGSGLRREAKILPSVDGIRSYLKMAYK